MSTPDPRTAAQPGVAAKRLLVTGASGFIGTHCRARLRGTGWEVHAVSSRPAPSGDAAVRWHRADLLHPGAAAAVLDAAGPTHLLHLAWGTASAHQRETVAHVQWLQASLELLREFANRGGRRVVMAGTCAEYDWRYGYCSETETPAVPATLYGECKRALGQVLNAFAASTGLSSAWARVFFVYGPHEPPGRLIPSVARALLHGEPAPCTHGRQVRDYLYVADVADALVTLLESGTTGTVNVGSGRPVELKAILYILAALTGGSELLRFGALPVPPDEAALVAARVGRLRDEVGWSPRTGLDQGLEQTVSWWRQELRQAPSGIA